MTTMIKRGTAGLKYDLNFINPSSVVKDTQKKWDLRRESIKARNILMEWIVENKIANSFDNSF